MLMRVAMTVAVSQMNSAVCDAPVGGVNDRYSAAEMPSDANAAGMPSTWL